MIQELMNDIYPKFNAGLTNYNATAGLGINISIDSDVGHPEFYCEQFIEQLTALPGLTPKDKERHSKAISKMLDDVTRTVLYEKLKNNNEISESTFGRGFIDNLLKTNNTPLTADGEGCFADHMRHLNVGYGNLQDFLSREEKESIHSDFFGNLPTEPLGGYKKPAEKSTFIKFVIASLFWLNLLVQIPLFLNAIKRGVDGTAYEPSGFWTQLWEQSWPWELWFNTLFQASVAYLVNMGLQHFFNERFKNDIVPNSVKEAATHYVTYLASFKGWWGLAIPFILATGGGKVALAALAAFDTSETAYQSFLGWISEESWGYWILYSIGIIISFATFFPMLIQRYVGTVNILNKVKDYALSWLPKEWAWKWMPAKVAQVQYLQRELQSMIPWLELWVNQGNAGHDLWVTMLRTTEMSKINELLGQQHLEKTVLAYVMARKLLERVRQYSKPLTAEEIEYLEPSVFQDMKDLADNVEWFRAKGLPGLKPLVSNYICSLINAGFDWASGMVAIAVCQVSPWVLNTIPGLVYFILGETFWQGIWQSLWKLFQSDADLPDYFAKISAALAGLATVTPYLNYVLLVGMFFMTMKNEVKHITDLVVTLLRNAERLSKTQVAQFMVREIVEAIGFAIILYVLWVSGAGFANTTYQNLKAAFGKYPELEAVLQKLLSWLYGEPYTEEHLLKFLESLDQFLAGATNAGGVLRVIAEMTKLHTAWDWVRSCWGDTSTPSSTTKTSTPTPTSNHATLFAHEKEKTKQSWGGWLYSGVERIVSHIPCCGG